MDDAMKRVALFHVWIHSDADTGQPLSIAVFEVIGRVHMGWYADAMEPESESAQKELAEYFYRHLGCLDDSGWFVCRMETEDGADVPEHYVEVLGCLSAMQGME